MRFLILLMRQFKFWMLLAAFIVEIFGLILNFLLFSHTFEAWNDLPPLPKEETAHEFTDVLVMNRINVLTDQGHYFSCSYRSPETCWKSIPREVNQPKSTNAGIDPPLLPPFSRQMVTNSQKYSDLGDIVLVAIIRSNGQVACWEGISSIHPLFCRSFCGIFLIVLIGSTVSIVRRTQEKLRMQLQVEVE